MSISMKIKILLCKLISNINIKPRIGGVMVNVLVSRAVDRGLGVPVGSNLRLLNWYVLLSAKHATLSRNTKKDCLVRNHSKMCPSGETCLPADCELVLYQSDLTCWSSSKRTSSSHENDLVERFLIWH
jgi:hypothetical protein